MIPIKHNGIDCSWSPSLKNGWGSELNKVPCGRMTHCKVKFLLLSTIVEPAPKLENNFLLFYTWCISFFFGSTIQISRNRKSWVCSSVETEWANSSWWNLFIRTVWSFLSFFNKFNRAWGTLVALLYFQLLLKYIITYLIRLWLTTPVRKVAME